MLASLQTAEGKPAQEKLKPELNKLRLPNIKDELMKSILEPRL